MVNNLEEFAAYATHLAAEHRRLHEYVRKIERCWFNGKLARPAEVIPQVVTDLTSLRAELSHHFAEEEAGACLEEVVSRQPGLGHETTRLEHEHPILLGHLDRLIVKLAEASQAGRPVDDAKDDFRRLAKQLRDHETAENQVLRQCFGFESDNL